MGRRGVRGRVEVPELLVKRGRRHHGWIVLKTLHLLLNLLIGARSGLLLRGRLVLLVVLWRRRLLWRRVVSVGLIHHLLDPLERLQQIVYLC